MRSRPELHELNLTALNLTAEALHLALKEFYRERAANGAWQKLLLFRTTQRSHTFDNDRQVINQILFDALDRLEELDTQHARILQMRFLDKLSSLQVASKLNLAESTIYARQRAAIEQLMEIIVGREERAQSALRTQLARRLPLASYHQLVGVDGILAQLLKVIEQSGPPWLLSLEGIGGIGKTSLAHALLQQAAELGLFAEVAWVTAKDTRLTLSGDLLPSEQVAPARSAHELIHQLATILIPEALSGGNPSVLQLEEQLRFRLQETPHLIVVDNLETVNEVATLVPVLRKLANPTKFVLTTRQGLFGEPSIFPFSIVELGREAALAMLRQEAALSNLPDVVAADDQTLLPIYETVGGNALALRLIVGLLHMYDLPAILHNLREAHGLAVENLYTFIYRRAWDMLDPVSREVFLSMVLLRPTGDTMEYLAAISQVPAHPLHTALQKLVVLNLVEARGTIDRRLYTIHGLTRTFLLKQVAKWM